MGFEAEGEGGWTGALALWGRGFEIFLIERGSVVVVVIAEGAAAFEIVVIAARWSARLGFGDLGVVHRVRLLLLRLSARCRCEDDGAAEVWWCADDFGTGREGWKVAGEEGLQRATCAVHVGAGRLASRR